MSVICGPTACSLPVPPAFVSRTIGRLRKLCNRLLHNWLHFHAPLYNGLASIQVHLSVPSSVSISSMVGFSLSRMVKTPACTGGLSWKSPASVGTRSEGLWPTVRSPWFPTLLPADEQESRFLSQCRSTSSRLMASDARTWCAGSFCRTKITPVDIQRKSLFSSRRCRWRFVQDRISNQPIRFTSITSSLFLLLSPNCWLCASFISSSRM